MLEAKITIVAPELAEAINNLAAAIGGGKTQKSSKKTTTAEPQPQNTQPQPPIPQQPFPMNQPMPAPPVAPAAGFTPAPSVPLAQPPKYTVDQIMAAGAMLMDAGKVNELMNLLHSFGVQAVMDLKPEQLGAFATAMRGLGAQI